jgi:hypothetical protein
MASQKPDFPALLSPGIHKLSLHQLYELTVMAYPPDSRRADLFGRFALFCNELTRLGVGGYTWVDGSFMTNKPEPDDIDCVLWPRAIRQLSPADVQGFKDLVSRPIARARFGIDLYVEDQLGDFNREAYWRGVWGFCHDGKTAKGFAEVAL